MGPFDIEAADFNDSIEEFVHRASALDFLILYRASHSANAKSLWVLVTVRSSHHVGRILTSSFRAAEAESRVGSGN
jgi:hypothetical protein